MTLFLVCILGFFLRLIFLNKPEGLWNDEYVSWYIASKPFDGEFFREIVSQCHMPLYYLYLKPFVNYSDIILRFTSLVPSVLAIPVMYLAGKEYSKKVGLFCALTTSVLPFLIYYAQEVRFYSILFLLSALFLLFMIKIIKTGSKSAVTGYVITALLIILTHITGIIFVTIATAALLFFKKKLSLRLILPILLGGVLIICLSKYLLPQINISQWWGIFSYTNILFLFSDYFSPILSNHVNAPPFFYYHKNPQFIMLITLPTVFAVIGIIMSVIKKTCSGFAFRKENCCLLSISLIMIAVMSVLAYSHIVVFISKYLIEILPILILLMILGYEKIKFGRALLILYIILLVFSIFTPYYPTKKFRSEGNKIVGDILNARKPDKIIFTYYDADRFKRYWNGNADYYSITKSNYKDYIDNTAKILDNINRGERYSIVFLNSVSYIPDNLIWYAKSINFPDMFIKFSVIKNNLKSGAEQSSTNIEINQIGDWEIFTATKK